MDTVLVSRSSGSDYSSSTSTAGSFVYARAIAVVDRWYQLERESGTAKVRTSRVQGTSAVSVAGLRDYTNGL